MTGGNWMPELIELAGGENVFADAQGRAPRISWQELIERKPDLIAISPCGFDIERTMSELRSLSMDPAYPGLDTIAAKPTYLIDGNQFMNRPGPRIVDSLEILAEIMHPELFSFAHEGKGWLRYSG